MLKHKKGDVNKISAATQLHKARPKACHRNSLLIYLVCLFRVPGTFFWKFIFRSYNVAVSSRTRIYGNKNRFFWFFQYIFSTPQQWGPHLSCGPFSFFTAKDAKAAKKASPRMNGDNTGSKKQSSRTSGHQCN